MSSKGRLAMFTAILFWASAFMGIRIGLTGYSPQGMALLRFLVASFCMAIIYALMPGRTRMRWQDVIGLMTLGGFSVGIYNLTLNYGEMTVISGVASFITSQSPIMAAVFAALLFGESLTLFRLIGFGVSLLGTALMTVGQVGRLEWSTGISYLLMATLAGSVYSILQKPFLKRCHAIEATTYIIWGCTLFLLMFYPVMRHDILAAPLSATVAVIYLGIFPAALGYLAWSYALSEIPATRAMSYLYFLPFLATIMGWLFLGEIPNPLSLLGGTLAIAGVWFVNKSYGVPAEIKNVPLEEEPV